MTNNSQLGGILKNCKKYIEKFVLQSLPFTNIYVCKMKDKNNLWLKKI